MKRQIQALNKAYFDDFVSQVLILQDQYASYLESHSHRCRGYSVAKAQMERRWKKPHIQLCYYVPFWYSYIFDASKTEAARTIALANVYMYHYFTLKDDFVDGELDLSPSEGLIIDLIFSKSIEVYLETNLDGRMFLADLNRYMEEALEAELFLNRHRGEISDYSEIDFIMMGKKAALLKVSAAAFSNLEGDRKKLARLEEVLLLISIALQLVDDLTDWKHDLKIKNYTFPLVKAIEMLSPSSINSIEEEQISWTLFSQRIDYQVLTLAIEYLNRAKTLLNGLDKQYLYSFVNGYIADIQARRHELQSSNYEWSIGDVILGKHLLQS